MMKKYETSAIIFDLDSISGIGENYSGFTEELKSASQTITLNRNYTFYKIRPKALDSALNIGKYLTYNDNLWVFYVGKSKKIIQELKLKLSFPEVESERAFIEKEMELDKRYICKNCQKGFTNRENEQ